MFYANLYREAYIQTIQMTQEEKQKQEHIAEYADIICGNIRSYHDNMQNEDYNLAVSITEQIVEGSLKMVGIQEENITDALEKSHNLLELRKLNDDIFAKFSDDSMRKAKNNYFYKYPNNHKHATREEAIKAGVFATKVADVAFEHVGIQGCDLDKELGEIDINRIHNMEDYCIWNRLGI